METVSTLNHMSRTHQPFLNSNSLYWLLDLSVADHVIGMKDYIPFDLTEKSRSIVAKYPVNISVNSTYGAIPSRIPVLPHFHLTQKGPVGRDIRAISTEITSDIDLSGIDQLVEAGQVRTAAEALRFISWGIEHGVSVEGVNKKNLTMAEWKAVLEVVMEGQGIDGLHTFGWVTGDLVALRGLDIMVIVNRIRGLKATKT